jgi:hypothetical protein
MPIYFAWFTTALLSVGADANDQNLPQSGRLLYCVISGFIDTYLTFREESTKDNFRIADKWDISDIAPIQTAVGWRYTFNTVLA